MSREERGRERDRDRGSKRFKYEGHTAEQLKKRANQSGGTRDWFLNDDSNVKVFTAKAGTKGNRLRILPPTWPDAAHWGYDVYVHFNIGPDNAAYLCPEKMLGERCPICEAKAKYEKEKDAEYIATLTPNKRVLMWIIDRDNEVEGPMLWSAPWTVDKDISKNSVDKRSGEVYLVDSPDDGYDIDIEREGEGRKTKYYVQLAKRSTPLNNDEALEYVQEHPIPDILQFFDYDHIAKAFSAKVASSDEGEETTTRRTREESRTREEPAREERTTRTKQSTKKELEYEDVVDMSRRELVKLALEEDIVADEDIDDLSDDELFDEVVKGLDLQPPKKEKEKEKEEPGRDRLRSLRNRK